MDRASRVNATVQWRARVAAGVTALVVLLCLAGPAAALTGAPDEFFPGFRLKLTFHANGIGAIGGRSRYVDLLKSTVDLDLGRLAGWQDAAAHVELLHNYGARPNDLVGSLQRTNDEDVATRRFRIYQAWVDQSFDHGRLSLRAGIYDFKQEFAVLESADALINPSFGISPELANSGPNGAPVFPTSALAMRLRAQTGGSTYVQVAAINAHAGTVGDAGGLDTSFRDGALLIAEAGAAGRGRFAVGAWRYTLPVADLRARGLDGAPVPRVAQGAYALIERPLDGLAGPDHDVVAFARVGVSDARTTPFAASWQAGLRLEKVFMSRPDSVLSVGVSQALLSQGLRQNRMAIGRATPVAETAVEITYADRLGRYLTLQPDLQWIHRPALNRFVRDACVIGMRLKFEI